MHKCHKVNTFQRNLPFLLPSACRSLAFLLIRLRLGNATRRILEVQERHSIASNGTLTTGLGLELRLGCQVSVRNLQSVHVRFRNCLVIGGGSIGLLVSAVRQIKSAQLAFGRTYSLSAICKLTDIQCRRQFLSFPVTINVQITNCVSEKCAKLFLSELRQTSTNFNTVVW